jgi:hypothetical protein
MATKENKGIATKPAPAKQSPAQTLQAQSHRAPDPHIDPPLGVTLRNQNGYEYHMEMTKPVIEKVLDPDVPDTFIEVPCKVAGTKRFLSTAFVAEIDVRGL